MAPKTVPLSRKPVRLAAVNPRLRNSLRSSNGALARNACQTNAPSRLKPSTSPTITDGLLNPPLLPASERP